MLPIIRNQGRYNIQEFNEYHKSYIVYHLPQHFILEFPDSSQVPVAGQGYVIENKFKLGRIRGVFFMSSIRWMYFVMYPAYL